MNDTSVKAVDEIQEILGDMRENAYSLETDSGKADMVTGKVVANMQWSVMVCIPWTRRKKMGLS